jgi:hypothetical protein
MDKLGFSSPGPAGVDDRIAQVEFLAARRASFRICHQLFTIDNGFAPVFSICGHFFASFF